MDVTSSCRFALKCRMSEQMADVTAAGLTILRLVWVARLSGVAALHSS